VRLQKATQDLLYVYTAVLRKGEIYFVLDTAYFVRPPDDTDPPPSLGVLYTGQDPSLRRALSAQSAVADPAPVAERVRTYMSAFAPFRDSAGEFVGVVGVDMWARDLDDRLVVFRHAAWAGLSGVAGLSLLAGLLVYRLRVSAATAEERELIVADQVRQEKEKVDQLNARLQRAIHEIEEEARAAEAANHAKSAFLAVMSHEIRTPMNGVLGMTQLLESTELNSEQREYIRTIGSCGETLLTIINDVLDYSKIEAGRVELEHLPVDVRLIVDTVLDLCSARAAEKRLELVSLVDPDVPGAVFGDATRLQQILFNLVGNALKFTPAGEVFVSVRRAPDDPGRLEFRVRDTGIGIPADRRDRLFKPFSQVDSATTRQYGGTGLGLAIAHRLTELMQGRIGVDSEPGRGSTFYFSLPCEVPPDAPPPPHAAPEAALAGRRILVLSDNATLRQTLATMCRWWGMVPCEVERPAESLALLRGSAGIELALIDRQLGSRDGVELADAIHAIPGRESLPLFLLDSAGSRVPTGFTTLVAKPVKPGPLKALLLQSSGAPVEIFPVSGPIVSTDFDATFGRRMPLRILVVDDDAVNKRGIGLMLERLGYVATQVNDGREAVDQIRREVFDVVFMDIGMPGMDGREATRRIRSASRHPGVPWIVAFTAAALPSERAAWLAGGMNDCLLKPYRADELTQVLARAFRALQQIRGPVAG
jgi:signal transduction histidine kinase/DNA-binding response OmpR family regulator